MYTPLNGERTKGKERNKNKDTCESRGRGIDSDYKNIINNVIISNYKHYTYV